MHCVRVFDQDLRALATNLFKVRHKPLAASAGRQRQQKPVAGPIRIKRSTPFNRARFALALKQAYVYVRPDFEQNSS